MAYAAFLRPISALAAGILADRYSGGKIVVFSFLGAATTYLIFAISGSDMLSHLFMVNVLVSFVFVFAIRAVYFALLAESNVDAHVTGTSIGFISLVGFTPDIFFAPITGRILDATPGLEGFQHLFTLLVVIALIGAVAALALIFNLRNKKQNT